MIEINRWNKTEWNKDFKKITHDKSREGALYKMIMIWEGWSGGDEFDN